MDIEHVLHRPEMYLGNKIFEKIIYPLPLYLEIMTVFEDYTQKSRKINNRCKYNHKRNKKLL